MVAVTASHGGRGHLTVDVTLPFCRIRFGIDSVSIRYPWKERERESFECGDDYFPVYGWRASLDSISAPHGGVGRSVVRPLLHARLNPQSTAVAHTRTHTHTHIYTQRDVYNRASINHHTTTSTTTPD